MELLVFTTLLTPMGRGQQNSYKLMPHCLGAGGSVTPCAHYLVALKEWVVVLLLHTNPMTWGRGQ